MKTVYIDLGEGKELIQVNLRTNEFPDELVFWSRSFRKQPSPVPVAIPVYKEWIVYGLSAAEAEDIL